MQQFNLLWIVLLLYWLPNGHAQEKVDDVWKKEEALLNALNLYQARINDAKLFMNKKSGETVINNINSNHNVNNIYLILQSVGNIFGQGTGNPPPPENGGAGSCETAPAPSNPPCIATVEIGSLCQALWTALVNLSKPEMAKIKPPQKQKETFLLKDKINIIMKTTKVKKVKPVPVGPLIKRLDVYCGKSGCTTECTGNTCEVKRKA